MSYIKTKVAAAGVAVAVALGVSMSPQAVDELKVHEGVRTTAYADPYYGWQLPTICYGSTAGVTRGQKATLAECDARLRVDIDRACKIVERDLKDTGVRLTQGEQDAYCSFAFNTGYFKYQRNGNLTSMYTNLVAGRPEQACKALNLYVLSNGVRSNGLVKRRAVESQRCTSEL